VSRSSPDVPFQAHVELLHFFLDRRDDIVERIQGVLNAQRKPIEDLQDGPLLARHFEDCFFTTGGVTDWQSRLRGQLEEAHWASGFRPRAIPGLHNGPADPAEMMMRAFYMWRQTRWPGRNGRVRFAHTLFNLYVVRCLELLCMRLWDADAGGAGDRLAQAQAVLDRLWHIKTTDQPAFVSDARWLIQTAQSLATDDLGAYFRVAAHIAESLPGQDGIEIHRAGGRMAGGHLRSQTRYHATKDAASLDEPNVILSTRESNALDFALLIQDLVPLLEAYEHARHLDRRLELADAICQAISPDPELFVNRVELLGAYSMIEPLFITIDRDGAATYTPMGQRHVELFKQYEGRIDRVAKRLYEDCSRFRPVAGTYSPYGVLYGFSADLVKHMVLKASQPDAVNHFGLEDVFVAGDASKLAWVTGWRKLPHLTRDVERLFDYPQQFAEDVFDRIERALRRRAAEDQAQPAARTGRLLLVPSDGRADSAALDVAQRYLRSSDQQIVSAGRAGPYDDAQLARDRREGKFLVSCQTPGGWLALRKSVLTEVLGAGRDATIVGLPPAAVGALQLICAQLIA
jgi:hypothetical protein